VEVVRVRHRVRAPSGSELAVAAVLVVAGLMFATSAQTAKGTQLRSDGADVVSLAQAETARADARRARVDALRQEVQDETDAVSTIDGAVAAVKRRADALAAQAGLAAVHGPGMIVTLDDAPRSGTLPSGVRPDDLVVHQQDVQAVVNALWHGGAEAMMLMDQRVISTSAVRCVGNTLILQGRVYSPPYRIAAIGSSARLQRALDASPDVAIYQQYVQAYGLGFAPASSKDLTMPAFSGTLDLRYARVVGPAG
jgi:uncharacterized protein YlxW (UPF0749 family)